jgi:L-amino acid N-acyltransferase YncA
MSRTVEPWKPPGAHEVEMAAVVALYRHALAAATPGEQKAAVTARAALEDWFKVPKTVALIAKVGETVDGLLVFRAEPPAVRIVYIAAREYRHGTGSQLLGALKDLCAKKGMKELKVVFSDGDARQKAFFTQKHGFRGAKPAGKTPQGTALTEATLAIPAGSPT